MVTDVLGHSPHKRFYEKVIKVKADVAAVLNCFFPSCVDLGWVTWELSKAPPKRGVHQVHARFGR